MIERYKICPKYFENPNDDQLKFEIYQGTLQIQQVALSNSQLPTLPRTYVLVVGYITT